MNDRQQILGGILTGLLIGLPSILTMVSTVRAKEPNRQLVLQIANRPKEEATDRVVIPRATVILRLAPVSGQTSKAPLAPGDYMLCRPDNLLDNLNKPHAGFRCGGDAYAIVGISYEEQK